MIAHRISKITEHWTAILW